MKALGNPEMSNKMHKLVSQIILQLLDSLARDLTVIAKDGTLDPVIGRDKEITRVIEVLSRRTKTILCLLESQVLVKLLLLKV